MEEIEASLSMDIRRAVVATVVVPPSEVAAFSQSMKTLLQKTRLQTEVRWFQISGKEEGLLRELNRERDLWIPSLRLLLLEMPDETVRRWSQGLAPDLFSMTDLLITVVPKAMVRPWDEVQQEIRGLKAAQLFWGLPKVVPPELMIAAGAPGLTLVLGGAGSGKTAMLTAVARDLGAARVPILIQLPEYLSGDARQPAEEMLVRWLERNGIRGAVAILEHLSEVTLLMDGLDEVPGELERKILLEDVRQFSERRGVPILMAMRDMIVQEVPESLLKNSFWMAPLSDNEIEEVLGSSRASLWKRIQAEPDLLNLARSPVCLMLLREIFEITGQIPDRREELVGTALRLMASDPWDARLLKQLVEHIS